MGVFSGEIPVCGVQYVGLLHPKCWCRLPQRNLLSLTKDPLLLSKSSALSRSSSISLTLPVSPPPLFLAGLPLSSIGGGSWFRSFIVFISLVVLARKLVLGLCRDGKWSRRRGEAGSSSWDPFKLKTNHFIYYLFFTKFLFNLNNIDLFFLVYLEL
jgi:hypothetical protein